MSYLATLSKKGLMTIPTEVRRKYGLKDGDRVRIIDQGGVLMIIPLTDIKTLYGLGAEHKEELLMGVLKSLRKSMMKRPRHENMCLRCRRFDTSSLRR